MIRSMTAYASRTGNHDAVSWVWEMRGVNARGLDLRLRLPEGLDGLEATVRTVIKDTLTRGNISLSLRLQRDEAAQPLALDTAQLDRVLGALDQVQERAFAMGVTLGQPTAADVLNTRGVVTAEPQEQDTKGLVAALSADVAPLLADFTAMRAQEGAALEEVLLGQINEIGSLVDDAAAAAEARRPQAAQALKDSLAWVLEDVAEVDEQRIAQELAMIAAKQDITEEIDRLRAHVTAARAMVAASAPTGRKLDFLAQEFNREANTLCSKSQNAALTKIGLDLKVVIDQMREQVQNVE
ncbi:YicC/YloC family endoribonuclease [Yoonia sp. R2331]|uniref:YicC/YloC family endoribonuclease n=1 Tax=Yoonia sp. R2331 TaxID=3237238 RepID=UPI0034E5202E